MFLSLINLKILREKLVMVRDGRLVCITGGAGFIGSALVAELNTRNIDSILIVDDIRSTEKWKNLVGKRFCDIIPIQGSLHTLEKHKSSIGSIVHLGACSSTTETNADYLLENNYRYSVDLAKLAVSHNIRFVYASSAATYGDGSNGFSDSLDHLETLRPLNMYGYSKHLFDLWALRNSLFNIILGLKYFNVFGPNEWHKGRMASAILRMVPEALSTNKIQLFSSKNYQYADGEQLRDFIYVKDCVGITADLLERPICGILNVGSGEACSWNRLAKAVFSSLSLIPQIEYIPMPDDLTGKYQYFTQADTANLQAALSRPICRFTLEEAVFDYVNSHILPERPW